MLLNLIHIIKNKWIFIIISMIQNKGIRPDLTFTSIQKYLYI